MAEKSERAFELKAEFEKDFAGASMAFGPEGKTVNIKDRLDNNGGTIVTDDMELANALAGHDALKEVPVPSSGSSGKSDKGGK